MLEKPDSDLADILHSFTNHIMNERVRSYNEGLDAGIAMERARCAKIAENEIDPEWPNDDQSNQAKVIVSYIRSGAKPDTDSSRAAQPQEKP